MKLEEMQAVWSEMGDQLEKQKKLTDKMISMMIQEKYRNKLNKIAYPEILGAIICITAAVMILLNFNMLDNWYTQVSGIISILVLLLFPILSLRSINRMSKVDIAGNNYKETLLEYAKGKKQFMKVMKLSYYLGFILMFVIMPVTSKLIKGKDIFAESISVWTYGIAIPLAISFFIIFSRWVYKSYQNNIDAAESLINELEEND
ncbi:hypothetical protein [Aquimarina mytili]|uniref:DUF3278 domain-containing protein n=1 Tax=Aquimarina mytili TaxID=874423 RepID=A0A937A1M7_9FLAO|nr:hypothetical protein [Aquimarina mytili]MBL0685830.1 hypothetical protein [Aquimarina mytili]